MDVSFSLCSTSGISCEIPFKPSHYSSGAIHVADCKTRGALAHSLVPVAFENARLGLCMVILNTKYVAAGQKVLLFRVSNLLAVKGLLDALL